jgi:hypothetical protein
VWAIRSPTPWPSWSPLWSIEAIPERGYRRRRLPPDDLERLARGAEKEGISMSRWSSILVLVTLACLVWDGSYWVTIGRATPGYHGLHWQSIGFLLLFLAAFRYHLSRRRRG